MSIFKILIRIFLIITFASVSAFSVVLDTDDFSSSLENWSGSGVVQSSGVMEIAFQSTASKSFNHSSYPNTSVTFTVTLAKVGTWENDDTAVITMNGITVYDSNTVGTIVLNGATDANGLMNVTIKANSNQNTEKLNVDNVELKTGATYDNSFTRNFTQAYSSSFYANIKIIGNSVVYKADTGDCAPVHLNNNNYQISYADKDSDATTVNSTSAGLTLPVGVNKIKYAALHWQGRMRTSASLDDGRDVSIKLSEDINYRTVTANPSKFNWITQNVTNVGGYTGPLYSYQGVADITALLQADLNNVSASVINSSGYSGTLWVADVITEVGMPKELNGFGSWALVVVYEDSADTLKNINVYDGYLTVQNSTVSQTLSGFYTPTSGVVSSKFLLFGGEGDYGQTDTVTLTNKSGTAETLGTDVFQSTITDASGANITTRNPSCENAIGADIHTFDIGTSGTTAQIIENGQSSTVISITSTSDGFFPGIFAFATDMYVPNICYDYAFAQYDRFFAHDSSITAHLHGYLSDTSRLTTRIMLRNLEQGSEATNVKLRINDINRNGELQFYTNQAELDLKKTVPDGVLYTSVPSSDITTLTAADLKFNLVTGTNKVGYNQSVYSQFYLEPLASGDIDTPLEMYIDFNFTAGINIFNMNNLRLDETVPRCVTDAGSAYDVNLDIFNTVDSSLNAPPPENSTTVKYNLPTHVVNRPIDLKIVSFNPASLHTVRGTSGMIALELIDMGGYYDSKSACADPNSVISPRLWIPFGNYDANTTYVTVDENIFENTFNPGITQVSFFAQARENAAYRMSYNLDDDNGSVKVDEFNPGRYKLAEFTTYAGQPCATDIDGNPSSTDTVPQWCGNNGTGGGNGMTAPELRVCMQCIFGLKTRTSCSRDNFSIRPEAFDIKITDSNNSAVIPYTANVAAGYDYRFDINATTHTGSEGASGYSAVFKEGISLSDRNASFTWASNGRDVSGCNDVTSPSVDFYFANGTIANQLRHLDNVGRYEMGLRDYAWTKVDQVNHTAGNNWEGGQDCVVGASTVPLYTSNYTLSKPGCIISSEHHNINTGADYHDYNLTFRPYKFEMASIGFGLGTVPNGIGSGGNGFVYTSDMSRNDSMNMSLRATGNINAVGKNGVVTTNFVTACYAEDLSLSMSSFNNLSLAGTNYQVRFMDFNSSGVLIYDSNATDVNTSGLTMVLTTIDDGNYTKSTAGALSTITRLNYDRSFTQTTNPITAQYNGLGVKCTSPASCTMYADGVSTFEAVGSRAMDFNVTHAYGRIIPRDVRVFGNVDFTANAWYEVFNAPTLAETTLTPSRNGVQWFTNSLHNDNNDGNADVTVILPNTLTLQSNSDMPNPPNTGMETYTFDGIDPIYSGKAHINTDPWLWFGTNALDYLDPSAGNLNCQTHPCFNINVVPNIGTAGSATTTDQRDKKDNKATSQTGVTYDYTPATR